MDKTNFEAADRKDGSAHVVDTPVSQQLAAFVADFEDHLEKLRKSVTIAEAKAAEKKRICAALPASLPLAPMSLVLENHAYKADARFGFEVSSRDEVLALVESLPSVPVVLVNGSTSTFIPAERFVEERGNRATVTSVGDVTLRVETWLGYLREEYTWWTKLADKLVEVVATTRKDAGSITRAVGSLHPETSDTVRIDWHYDNLPAGVIMQWHGGSRTSVAPLSVHQQPGGSLKEAFEQPQRKQVSITRVRSDCYC